MDDCYVEAEEQAGYSEERRLSECGEFGFLIQEQLTMVVGADSSILGSSKWRRDPEVDRQAKSWI